MQHLRAKGQLAGKSLLKSVPDTSRPWAFPPHGADPGAPNALQQAFLATSTAPRVVLLPLALSGERRDTGPGIGGLECQSHPGVLSLLPPFNPSARPLHSPFKHTWTLPPSPHFPLLSQPLLLMSNGGEEQRQQQKPVCGTFPGEEKGSTRFLKSPKAPSQNLTRWLSSDSHSGSCLLVSARAAANLLSPRQPQPSF